MNADERRLLRELARRAVAAAAEGAPPPVPAEVAEAFGRDLGPHLLAPGGAFVSLHLNGALRGCIGYIEGRGPLVDAVVENGTNAAVMDPRFAPVDPSEVPFLELEVSVLSPLSVVCGPENIVIGRHGVVLAKNGRKAVFLPQVALEQGWDVPTMLEQLCAKAGLATGEWRDGAVLSVFEAEVF